MRNYLFLFISFITINSFSQDNLSVLAVSGESKLLITPDITVINIELNSTNIDYSQSVNSLQQKSVNLKSFLKDKGIVARFIKSENFQVEKQYGYENGTRKYLGYIAKLWIRLEFLNDNNLANKIINAIGSANTDADISISFEISIPKQDSINDKLIEFAIRDANKKATLIAKSTNQQIVKIDKINYGVNDGAIFENAVCYDMISSSASSGVESKSFTITPKDIEKSTKIIIYWQLSKN